MADSSTPPHILSRPELLGLLEWYAESGVDIALDETAHDRFGEAEAPASPLAMTRAAPAPAPPRAAPSAPRPASTPVPPTDDTAREAREIARAAQTLDELRAALDRFEGCNLRLTANQLVFADGTPGSRLMLVGEAPGRDEDIQGLPFVGRSGQLLDRMLAAIGLDRTNVYIANVVPWRPPGNRTPTPQETAVCRPFLERQIELCNPDMLVCLGAAAAKELMATSEGILRIRGQWRYYDLAGRKIRIMATLHPAYLLRQPLQKRLAWRDFLAIRAALDAPAENAS
jgi:uracil-DNA glycosylase family 4